MPTQKSISPWRLALLLSLFVTALAGCDRQKVEEAVNVGVEQATEVVEQTVETVKQEANLAGSMELSTDPPVNAKACYAKLIVIGEGRPNVLRLASYKNSELERFPSMMIEAQVDQASLDALAGQTVQAKVYAQSAADGPVWTTPSGSLTPLSIVSLEADTLTCECAGATLVNSDSDEQATVNGKFVAVVQQ